MCCSSAFSFFTTQPAGTTPLSSRTHQSITEDAIRQIAKTVMQAYPEQYPDPSLALATQARKQFLAAVALPDRTESDVPEAHFHSETFGTGTDRIREFRLAVISGIRAGYMENARILLGRAIHMLQDFYST